MGKGVRAAFVVCAVAVVGVVIVVVTAVAHSC